MTEVQKKTSNLVDISLNYPKFFLRILLNYWILSFYRTKAITGITGQYFKCVGIYEFSSIKKSFFVISIFNFIILMPSYVVQHCTI